MARLRCTLTALALAVLMAVTVAAPAAAHAVDYPTPPFSPVGANDWDCRPTAAHPEPVVIVHGTFGDKFFLLNSLSWRLKGNGYCVFSLDYGNRGTGPIGESAGRLGDFVDQVLAATGAAKVSMVGHSQGGMMPRYYIKFLDGAGKVEDLIGVVPSNHGTYNSQALAALEPVCYACLEQAGDSEFIARLNAGDETPGDVDYTQITSRYDTVVVPFTSAYLEPGPQSTNILLQDSCALDTADHLSAIFDRIAISWALNALGREGPADKRADIGCL